jgi:hypothetical protein
VCVSGLWPVIFSSGCVWMGGVCGLTFHHSSSSFICNVHCRYQVPMVWLSPHFMWGNVGYILGSFSLLSPMWARVCVRAGCVCVIAACVCVSCLCCVCVCVGGGGGCGLNFVPLFFTFICNVHCTYHVPGYLWSSPYFMCGNVAIAWR